MTQRGLPNVTENVIGSVWTLFLGDIECGYYGINLEMAVPYKARTSRRSIASPAYHTIK